MLFYVLAAAVVVVGVIAFFVLKNKTYTSENVPVVQGGIPFLGQVLVMLKGSPWDTMSKWVAEYGEVYKFILFGSEAVCIADPELLKVVLQTKLNTFKKDREWTYRPFLVLLGNGIVTSEGHQWLKQRTLLATLLKKDILLEIPAMTIKALSRLCQKLDKARDEGKVIEMSEEFRHLTLQVVAEAILSLTPEESDETFATMYLPIVEEGNLRTWHPYREFLLTPSWFKFQADVKKLDDYVAGLIVTRWQLRKEEAAAGKPTSRKIDVLDKILSAISDEDWGIDAIKQTRDEIKTFMLAGHETSASMLAWAFYELSLEHNKNNLDIVLQEASSVFATCRDKSGRIVSAPNNDVLMGLNLTECCLRESLRKYSVVPTVVRKAAEDVQMTPDYFVSKGSTIMVNIQGVHHNPKYWPEPLVYKPDRFLKEPQPYTFLPFVEGPRMCLGQYLSILESKIVLAVLLSTYRFEVINPEECGEKHSFMIPIIPKKGHFMKVYNR
mmetsp:Transcript_2212/g.2304  ORF Transcript_2212/g.2304 Transcript_2212/m.2304 type:complete len:496 (+) Transcript_2212:174-1661(+)